MEGRSHRRIGLGWRLCGELVRSGVLPLPGMAGSASASPSSNLIALSRALATATIADEKSSPTGVAPRAAARKASRPGPQATSSIRTPRPTLAVSSKASMNGAVAPANVAP